MIEVDVGVFIQNPVFEEVTKREDIEVETLVESYNQYQVPEEVTEHDDEELTREITIRKRDIEHQQQENINLRSRFEQVQTSFVQFRQTHSTHEEAENFRLRGKLQELQSRLRNATEQKTRLVRKSLTRGHVFESVIKKDERVEQLKRQLRNLIEENNMLCTQITNKGESIRKSMRRSSFVRN